MNEDLLNNPENPCESNILEGRATLSSNKKGFTLAEILIVVVILGLITTLTVPSLINKQRETANRTKIKKAMATYDKALSQYYINGNYNAYISDYSSSSKIDPNNELDGLTGAEKTAARRRLLQERKDRLAALTNNYVGIFKHYFNIRENDSDNEDIFMTSDGLWWDLNPDDSTNNGAFASVIVAFKREDLTTAMANSKENKAFYFLGTIPDYAVTPITNPTYGKNVESLDINDLASLGVDDANNTMRMQKLYNYINNKNYDKIADYVCNTNNCCNNKSGSCLQFNNNHILVKNKEGLDMGVSEYQDSTLKSLKFYNSDKELIVDVDYENTLITIDKPNEEKRCYTFKSWVDNKCEGRTQGGPITFINEHAYSDPNYRWTQYGYSGCTVSKTTCPEE